MDVRWAFTVASVMPSLRPICLLGSPFATKPRVSSSRGLSSISSAVRGRTSAIATFEASGASPRAAARMAFSISSGVASFS